ncbi:hypothetical protein [Salmonella enterica]|uniref:hypothetical protein n=1 Tax=Salmonella enterica TaxID=28901 RepID=UPI001184F8A0|nr:hypothetical protein [Salmonella enterica]
MSSNAEWYIGHALVELLEQERMVSLFSVIDILERRLQDGNSSRDEFMDILEAIEKSYGAMPDSSFARSF